MEHVTCTFESYGTLEETMLTRQLIHFDDDGTYGIRNTFDASHAIEETRRMNETEECMGKDGYILGNIPQEMFMYDPWLKAAQQARKERDYAKYTDYMLKFFRVHSALACNLKRTTWAGWNVPIIDGRRQPKRPDAMEALLRNES